VKDEFSFVVLGPDGAVARIVTDAPECPSLVLDGATQPMALRAAPDARFPVRVCEAPIPRGTAAAAIGGHPLPLPKPPRRIVAFGDTGCRMIDEPGFRYHQACNDPAAWPFIKTSAAAARLKPDLVIHVGDYDYRESACPADDAGCSGSPVGYDWAAWRADFFAPAAALLRTAPWVMTRGNHENCGRANEGFFRLLDPRPMPAQCPAITDPYTVTLGIFAVIVLDSGAASDFTTPPDLVAVYQAQFAALNPPPGAWLLTHRPIWAFDTQHEMSGETHVAGINQTLEAASGNALPPAIAMVVAGHTHLFEALSFADRRPPQLVLGTGGDLLSDEILAPPGGRPIAGSSVAHGRIVHAWGFTVFERAAKGWKASFRDPDGVPRFTCAIVERDVRCAP